jgi:hypothetical protein
LHTTLQLSALRPQRAADLPVIGGLLLAAWLGLDAATAVAWSGHTELAHLLDQSELGSSPDNRSGKHGGRISEKQTAERIFQTFGTV